MTVKYMYKNNDIVIFDIFSFKSIISVLSKLDNCSNQVSDKFFIAQTQLFFNFQYIFEVFNSIFYLLCSTLTRKKHQQNL